MERDQNNIFSEDLLQRGNQFYRDGDFDSALQLYLSILRFSPENLPALINAANCYFELKDFKATQQIAARILSLDSKNINALSLLGAVSMQTEAFEEAAEYFQQVLQLDSQDIWSWNYLSQALQNLGRYQTALEAAWQAVEISNGEDSQQINFAYALYEIALEQGPEFVASYVQKWQNKFTTDSLVDFVAAALKNNPQITKSDSVYVRKIFDVFANSFDETLAALDYKVPQLIAQQAAQIRPDPPSSAIKILDAGCGTGLCGFAVKEVVPDSVLTGVDLSAQMLEKASEKKLYYQLAQSELEAFLAASKDKFDLVIAADVLTYFGRLDSLFSKVYSVLDSNGYFIFSVTENNVDSAPWFLHLSGRFLHEENYLRSALGNCGFSIVFWDRKMLRTEAGEPVWGWIITAKK